MDTGRLHVRGTQRADETAYLDGYSFRFFHSHLHSDHRGGYRGSRLFLLHVLLGELLLAKTLTSVEAKPIAATMTRTAAVRVTNWPAGGRRLLLSFRVRW